MPGKKQQFGLVLLISVIYALVLYALQKSAGDAASKVFQSNIATARNPAPSTWLYRESLIFLGAAAIAAILSIPAGILLQQINRLGRAWNTIWLLLLFILVTLLTTDTAFFMKVKRNIYALLAVIALGWMLFKPSVVLVVSDRLRRIALSHPERIAWALIIVSTLQRLGALLFLDPFTLVPGDDPLTFHKNALALNAGAPPSAGFSPLMSFFLAGHYLVFGVHQWAPKISLIALSVPALYCLYRAGAEITDRPAIGLLALAFPIINNHFVYFSNLFWNENLFALILMPHLWLLVRTLKKEPPGFIVPAGLALTAVLLSLARSWFPVIALLIALLILMRRPIKLAVPSLWIYVVLLVVGLASYSIYISGAHKQPMLISNNGTLNYVIGNHPYSQGTYTRSWQYYEKKTGLDVRSAKMARKVLRYQWENPGHTLKMLGRKTLLWFVGAAGTRNYSKYYNHPRSQGMHYFRIITGVLCLLGLFTAARKRIYFPAMYFGIMTAVHLVFFADYRSTLTALPVQALAIAVGLLFLSDGLKQRMKN